MYTVYIDGNLLYSPNLIKDGYAILDGKITTEINKAGNFKFTVPPNNPEYNNIKQLTSVVIVYDGQKEVFRGRVLNYEDDFYNNRSVYCEGWLSVLLDSIVRPYDYSGNVLEYFTKLITEHNAKMGAEKQLTIGEVTVTDPNDYITRASSNYPRTWDEINDKLINLLGGYIRIRHTAGINYLDYLSDYNRTNNQIIEFAQNLLDLSKFISGEDVYTILIPLGAKNEESDTRLDITSVNNGKDYIEDETATTLFGEIEHVEMWDDVTIADNLLSKARDLLTKNIELSVSLTMRAFDLHILNVDTNSFEVGDKVRVVSLPHSLDNYFQCSKITLDILNPSNSEYIFGLTYKTLTGQNAKGQATLQGNINSQIEELRKTVVTQPSTVTTTRAPSGNLWGDVNGDGVFNETDINLLSAYLLNPSTEIDLLAADINDDGDVNDADMVALSRLLIAKQQNQIIAQTISSKNGVKSVTYSLVYDI